MFIDWLQRNIHSILRSTIFFKLIFGKIYAKDTMFFFDFMTHHCCCLKNAKMQVVFGQLVYDSNSKPLFQRYNSTKHSSVLDYLTLFTINGEKKPRYRLTWLWNDQIGDIHSFCQNSISKPKWYQQAEQKHSAIISCLLRTKKLLLSIHVTMASIVNPCKINVRIDFCVVFESWGGGTQRLKMVHTASQLFLLGILQIMWNFDAQNFSLDNDRHIASFQRATTCSWVCMRSKVALDLFKQFLINWPIQWTMWI